MEGKSKIILRPFLGRKEYGVCPFCSAIVVVTKDIDETQCNNCKAELIIDRSESKL